MIFEYIFMFVAIVFIIKGVIQKIKEKKIAKEKGEKPKEENPLIFKWVKQSQIIDELDDHLETEFFSRDTKLRLIGCDTKPAKLNQIDDKKRVSDRPKITSSNESSLSFPRPLKNDLSSKQSKKSSERNQIGTSNMTPLQRFSAQRDEPSDLEVEKEQKIEGNPVKRPTRRKGKKRSTVDNTLRKAQKNLHEGKN